MIDPYFGYPHVHDCGTSAPTKLVIAATLDLIQQFSIPEIIYLDRGPQFIKEGDFDNFYLE
jgi:hypothetical protein